LKSPEGKPHSQVDHILIDRRRHSSVLDVRSFRAADCDTDHYLAVAKVLERLAVHKQRSHRFHVEKFNLKELIEAKGKEKYRVEVSNRFAALEDLDVQMDNNSGWEMIEHNMTISAKYNLGYFELKNYEPWFEKNMFKIIRSKETS
jgi:hypothetical protein